MSDMLARYVNLRQREHDARRDAVLAALSERERMLVKEAAVMGYVQGRMRPDLPVPKDRAILGLVLDACDAFHDLYPTITGAAEETP